MVCCDFLEEKQIHSCADYLKSQKIDILVNNAGFNVNESFSSIDLDVFKKIQQVNLFAPFVLCRSAVSGMEKKGWGRIVNISSIFGKISKAGRAAYSASKFGLDGLTVSLSAEYSSKGIMANCVAPGFIDTALTRRMLKPNEMKELISKVPTARLGEVGEISKLVCGYQVRKTHSLLDKTLPSMEDLRVFDNLQIKSEKGIYKVDFDKTNFSKVGSFFKGKPHFIIDAKLASLYPKLLADFIITQIAF